jgi:hypothetical protein
MLDRPKRVTLAIAKYKYGRGKEIREKAGSRASALGIDVESWWWRNK